MKRDNDILPVPMSVGAVRLSSVAASSPRWPSGSIRRQENKAFSEKLKRRIYKFIMELVSFIDTLPKNDSLCRIAVDQLLRSGTSIGANYVEAIAGSSKRDFANFLSHSLKSANESKFWLALLRDTNKGDREKINSLLDELIEISNIIGSSIRTLKGR